MGALSFLAALRKDSPAVGDVHVSSTGGKRPKAKPFKETISHEAKLPVTGADLAAQLENPDDKPAVGKNDAPRILKPIDGETAHSPFPYDPSALANIRQDQTPRFFGALTNPKALETRSMPLSDLTAMQDRVDPDKVDALRGGKVKGKHPVVVGMNGRNYIADGHHRLSAAWLDGQDAADVKFKDLEQVDRALKHDGSWSIPFKIAKADADQQLIFGWASVVEKNGQLIVDKQGDAILPADLENAAYDYVLYARKHGEMHDAGTTGRLVESMVFTKEKQDILGIDLGKVAWWTGFRVDDASTWAAHKRGELPEFSIGGTGRRVEI